MMEACFIYCVFKLAVCARLHMWVICTLGSPERGRAQYPLLLILNDNVSASKWQEKNSHQCRVPQAPAQLPSFSSARWMQAVSSATTGNVIPTKFSRFLFVFKVFLLWESSRKKAFVLLLYSRRTIKQPRRTIKNTKCIAKQNKSNKFQLHWT